MIRQVGRTGDPEIRRALRVKLANEHAEQKDTVLIDELGICRGLGRIDLVVVNSVVHGYEIKSNRDSMRRLESQVEKYSRVLERATVVVGDRHLNAALDIVPDWWGVLLFQDDPKSSRFKSVRISKKNPKLDSRSLVELLWRDEAIAFLDERSLAFGVRGKPRRFVWDRVCEHFQVREIAAKVRDQLKARSGHLILSKR
jgi:hypothetical protein